MRSFGGTVLGSLVLAMGLGATPILAATVSGPEAPLAPGQDKPAAGARTPSTVYRDADGTPYVFRNAQEKQYLSGYNVTWIDKDHVLTPPGVGGFN